jgi:YVTN family beta-propeller protein
MLPIETLLPMANPGANSNQQTFLRFNNPNDATTQVEVYGIDDGGFRSGDGAISFTLDANASKQITAQDVENGNADKNLGNQLCDGQGKWQLAVRSDKTINVMGLIRTPDGFLTSLNDVVPLEGSSNVAYFANPASNTNQQTFLRVVNLSGNAGTVTITGIDDSGADSPGSVSVVLSPYEGKQLTAQDLENGNTSKGLTGSLGDGQGKWRLTFSSSLNLEVMSLIRTPDGFLTNLSGMVEADASGDHVIYFANPASETFRTTFLRIINTSDQQANVTVNGRDDDGQIAPGGEVSFSLAAQSARQMTAQDLENGNAEKGLSGALGDGSGRWRLVVSADASIEVMSLVRTPDGFLTNLSRTAPVSSSISDVSIFNPASNTNQQSSLRLVNDSGTQGNVTVSGFDDAGNPSGDVTFNINAESAMTITSQDLESGTADLAGSLGDGTGKWRLLVSSDVDLKVQSLLSTPSGFLTNLSRTVPANEDRALRIFEQDVNASVIQATCINCHVTGGSAGGTPLRYVSNSDPDHVQKNFDTLKSYVQSTSDGADRLLSKPQGNLGHGGGTQITFGSASYRSLLEFLDRLGGEISDDNRPAEDAPGSGSGGTGDSEVAAVGYPTFLSPHAKPIGINGGFVYVTNTPADTVEVIDIASRSIIRRINVGVDPVGIAVRPDGKEVWVANHISDSVSVIDTDAASPTYHHVIATIQAIDSETQSTRFDEPVGVTFAGNQKAYVALSPLNEIAVIDVASYSVTGRLPITAQDPRAITVRGDRLYVIPFESNNQSQLSGCSPFIETEICTFDAFEHIFANNNVLSLDYDADIIKNPKIPDRDLYIFDTGTDELVEIVDTVGTLLYDLAVDSSGKVFVAQTDARNTANGAAGTLKHGLEEMDNRAFLNQITRVDCSSDTCAAPDFFDLEPLPPQHPEPGMALATPFGIEISNDDNTLVVTAAGSNKLFTVSAGSGQVLGRTAVGAVPRGIALESTGAGVPSRAWVLNAADNTVSVVDMSDTADLQTTDTIVLEDPTDPQVKAGRIAFNNADQSSTGTFSCESCHPDGHTDQLIWVLKTPPCAGDAEAYNTGCTQVPPRLTMPVRGVRDTMPLHWDGIPGDPYGGINTANITDEVEPNCDLDDPLSCARVLVDGALASTMCDQADCATNDEGKAGLLAAEERDAMARFLLSVPYPPAQERPITNEISAKAVEGYQEFNFEKNCGNCHRMPFLVSTNTPGTGMDAPTWRGAYDRWMITPQGRTNSIDLLNLVNIPDHFPEKSIWLLAGATDPIWQMVLELGTGFSGTYARQVTLNAQSAGRDETSMLLSALEMSAGEGAILLQGEGVLMGDDAAFEFIDGAYKLSGSGEDPGLSRSDLLTLAAAGDMTLTLTGRSAQLVGFDDPQPGLWPMGEIQQQTGVIAIAHLTDELTLRMKGRHINEGANIILNGRKVDGSVTCEFGVFPACQDEIILITLSALPAEGGMHFLQVQNNNGKFSNDTMFFSEVAPVPARTGNIIASGGTFVDGDRNWDTVLLNGSVQFRNGLVDFDIHTRDTANRWRVQLNHFVMLVGGRDYTLCYRARASAPRDIRAYLDRGPDVYQNVGGGQRRAALTTSFEDFSHTFSVNVTDVSSRVAFDLAESNASVELDNIGLYEGNSCGTP